MPLKSRWCTFHLVHRYSSQIRTTDIGPDHRSARSAEARMLTDLHFLAEMSYGAVPTTMT